MNISQFLGLGAVLATTLTGPPPAQPLSQQHIQIAKIEIDPAQVAAYQAAVKEQIETAIKVEPGVLMLFSVADTSDPTHVTVFEIYKDEESYKAHLQSAHFLKYKATVEKMVKSLTLVRVDPIALGAK